MIDEYPEMVTSLGNRNLQIAWSSSRLSDFQKCPWYYAATHLQGWTPGRVNYDLNFGTIVHKGIEAYYACGGGAEERLRAALRAILTVGRGELPLDDEETVKTLPNAVRAIIAWADDYGLDSGAWLPLVADIEGANEISFEVPLGIYTVDGEEYTLIGTLDRVVEYKGSIAVIDSKTTKYSPGKFYFDRFSPDVQISTYAGVAKVVLPSFADKILIDAFFIQKTNVDCLRQEIVVNDGDEAVTDAKFWIKQAEACATVGFWPRNRSSCQLYGGCRMRGICSAAPTKRQAYLNDAFYQKERT